MTTATEATPPARRGESPPSRYRSDSVEFAPHPAVVSAARLRTQRALRAWDLEELAADCAQVVSELVSNALQAHRREHLNAPIRLTLLGGLRTVLIVVRDASDSPPAPTAAVPGLDGESGRGLCIVDVLSSDWGWKPAPGSGKTVRALLRASRDEVYRTPV